MSRICLHFLILIFSFTCYGNSLSQKRRTVSKHKALIKNHFKKINSTTGFLESLDLKKKELKKEIGALTSKQDLSRKKLKKLLPLYIFNVYRQDTRPDSDPEAQNFSQGLQTQLEELKIFERNLSLLKNKKNTLSNLKSKFEKQNSALKAQIQKTKKLLNQEVQILKAVGFVESQYKKNNALFYKQKGLLAQPLRKNKIMSVASGVVEFFDRIPHLGQVLIVKHSSDFRGVYSGFKIDKKIKLFNNITKDQILGSALKKHSEFDFSLWFESEPINTKAWFTQI